MSTQIKDQSQSTGCKPAVPFNHVCGTSCSRHTQRNYTTVYGQKQLQKSHSWETRPRRRTQHPRPARWHDGRQARRQAQRGGHKTGDKPRRRTQHPRPAGRQAGRQDRRQAGRQAHKVGDIRKTSPARLTQHSDKADTLRKPLRTPTRNCLGKTVSPLDKRLKDSLNEKNLIPKPKNGIEPIL